MIAETSPAAGLPWRSDDGRDLPAGLALPRAGEAPWLSRSMPAFRSRRPLKRWRYVGVFGDDAMACVGDVSIGPARQTFWAVWDRAGSRLYERTHLVSHRAVMLERGRARVHEPALGIELDVALDEEEGISSVCHAGASGYVWTRKQAGVAASGLVMLPGGEIRSLDARAVIDDTAGYHPRETDWMWCAGVGVSLTGELLAWNLVSGVNDPPWGSERSVWLDGRAREVGAVEFADDLTAVRFAEGDVLHFAAESTRRRHDNLLVVRSDYEQPFGSFSGTLPEGVSLGEGYGVMERHSARW